ncbi:MAG TPA: response regulator transcription factor [Nitriliruptorales bacterium]|nr:response regulator transcription factor [Nitriliruptorales bacterium]
MDTTAGDRRVLVVDDEPMVREVVARYLQRDGYRVDVAADGGTALRTARDRRPHLVILDLMLPDTSGLEVLRELRRTGAVPVILLTARGDEGDRVLGLELGADDYVVKPFSPRELTARVRSVLRRAEPRPPSSPLQFVGLRIDPVTREVTVDDRQVELTAREFELLLFLAGSPRQVFTRGQLLAEVWDSSADWQDPATVTVHVGRLRQKLERDPQRPRWLTTVRGVGYRFEP